jgi:L-alanine-DL-glutamate epimerase-like enolase superfamily enzyme
MRLEFASFPIPFRTSFEHAAAVRDRAENVLVLAEDDDGHIGLGEGCPREYVTGETKASALAALARWKASDVQKVDGRASLEAWMAGHETEIDASPSAFAALEIALLDVLARRERVSLERFLGVDESNAPPRTSAVYGSGSTAKFLSQAARFNLYGMHDAKQKVSGHGASDAARARLLACCGRVRLDANNLWTSAEQACRALADLRRYAWAVEEPLGARDFVGLAAVGTRTELTIVLDESVTRPADLARVESGPAYALNARVSKHGGLLRTLAMIRAARERGFSVIVGAQVGETSILARAGVVAARAAGPGLAGFEGAYGTRLLERDATTVSIGFGYGGRVGMAGIGAVGSGLTPTYEVRELVHAEYSAESPPPHGEDDRAR